MSFYRRARLDLGLEKWLLFGAFLVSSLAASAQISPPGLDGAKTVGWTAIGFSQQLAKNWSTSIYAGGSGQSNPDSYWFLKKPAIFVINQELYYTMSKRWQLAFCASLREQEFYIDDPPYSAKAIPWKKEYRYYLRLFYRQNYGRLSTSYSFRPELRTFYTNQGDQWSPTPQQMRFRLKAQLNYTLNSSATNSVIVANEVLVATDHLVQETKWSRVRFTEDRLSTYFRHSFRHPAVFMDIGLMHQFWSEDGMHYTMYFAVDFIFQNPFGHKSRKE